MYAAGDVRGRGSDGDGRGRGRGCSGDVATPSLQVVPGALHGRRYTQLSLSGE